MMDPNLNGLMIDDYARGRRPLTWADMRGPLPNSLAVFGDSIALYAFVTLTASSVVDNGDGTGTATIGSGHGSAVGQPVQLGACTAEALNVMDSVITSVASSTVFSFRLGGRTHGVTAAGGGGTVTFLERGSGRGFIEALETLRGTKFDTTWCAIGGATAAQIHEVARQSGPGPYQVAIVCAGMNNVYSAAQDYATAWAEIQALIDHAREVARIVVVVDIVPRDSGGAFWSAGKQTVHTQLNFALHQYCQLYGLVSINTSRAVWGGKTYLNSAATNPDPDAAMSFDGTHPSMPGAFGIAQLIKTELDKLVPMVPFRSVHTAMLGTDLLNILTNSNFATGSPTPTGYALTNVTASSTATSSVESRTVATHGDAFGKNWLITFNYASASGTASFRAALSASIHAALTAGKKFKAWIPFSITGGLDILGVDLLIQGTIGGGQTWQVYANSLDSNTDGASGDYSGVLETPEVVIPSGITACTPFVRVSYGSGQSSDGVLRTWHWFFRVYD